MIVAPRTYLEDPLPPAEESTELELPLGAHLGDLLSPDFLARHSRFTAEDEMFAASGFKIECAQDFADIPDDAWDGFIAKNTTFSTWRDMLLAARSEWVKLNF